MYFRGKKRYPGLALAAALLLCFPPSPAHAYDQAEAQKTAAKTNNTGSDDSMEAATTSAMTAMMNLAALNIPGAFSNGYKAYGQYINSEKLDDLEAKTLSRKNIMGSVAGGTRGAPSSVTPKATTFSRLDPSFLHKGKAAEVADEFERQSGMKREEFLRQLGAATDSDISYEDPALLQKLEARYNLFTNSVPNKDFRNGLEKASSLFPSSARSEALGRLSAMYFDAWKGGGVTAAAPQLADANLAPLPSLTPTTNTATPEPAETRAPASASVAVATNTDADGIFIGIGGNSQDALKDFLGADDGSENDSLFKKISKRYRALTPTLVSRGAVLGSK